MSAADDRLEAANGKITSKMIASNVAPEEMKVPELGAETIVDDLYRFAARLRAGSTGRISPAESAKS
jgi:hypothetical protein